MAFSYLRILICRHYTTFGVYRSSGYAFLKQSTSAVFVAFSGFQECDACFFAIFPYVTKVKFPSSFAISETPFETPDWVKRKKHLKKQKSQARFGKSYLTDYMSFTIFFAWENAGAVLYPFWLIIVGIMGITKGGDVNVYARFFSCQSNIVR